MYSFNDTIEQAKKDYGLSKGEYLKVQEGDNRLRILSPSIGYQSEFTDVKTGVKKTSFKFVCWVLDRSDGVVKPYFMPMTVANAIGSFQTDPEYAFEDVPMPYDINIKAEDAGTLEVKYTVLPSRTATPLTEAELSAFKERESIEEFVEKLKKKQGGTAVSPETKELEDMHSHVRNLADMKGLDDAGLIDLGIELDKMTAETYPEYIEVLKKQPFKKPTEDVPFN